MATFTIIDYMSGLTGFVFDKSVLTRIAIDRRVAQKEPADLTQQDKDLLTADLLKVAYLSPNTIASQTNQHGAFTRTVGSQRIQDRDEIYNMMVRLYRKWNDDALEDVESASSSLQWLE